MSIRQTTWFLSQMITVRISQQARLEISLAGVQASEPGRLAAFICDHNCEFLRFYLRSPGYNWLGSGCSQWLLIKSLRVESSAMDRELGPSLLMTHLPLLKTSFIFLMAAFVLIC